MNRRTFITASSAAAVGFGANSILTIVLALVLMGGGRFSLDARLTNRHGQAIEKNI